MNRRTTGTLGESAASEALTRAGMKILARNFRRSTGEIDIIALDKRIYVFVEVKARRSLKYGRPSEAVDRVKQQHIVRTAQLWLSENGLDDVPVRFDVVEVLPDRIVHLRDAFDATDLF